MQTEKDTVELLLDYMRQCDKGYKSLRRKMIGAAVDIELSFLSNRLLFIHPDQSLPQVDHQCPVTGIRILSACLSRTCMPFKRIGSNP
jgi:hypothetical protein